MRIRGRFYRLRRVAMSVVVASLLGACDNGLQHDIAKDCNIALALNGGQGDVNVCITDSNNALNAIPDSEKAQAAACLHCIAYASSAICSCCQTNGQYDFVSSECAPSCDNQGMRDFCSH
jgi:hypothetical protein